MNSALIVAAAVACFVLYLMRRRSRVGADVDE